MSILAFGINHRTASVDVREKVAFDLTGLNGALRKLISVPGIKEAAILSTCNRTEIYCAGESELKDPALLHWLSAYHSLEPSSIAECSFSYHDEKAVSHVMRVASGLDSLVLGEPQILGQLKSAYTSAVEAETIGNRLGRLFETSFSVAKRIRTETAIGQSPVSVAAAAVSLARQLFSDFSDSSALLIGAGRTTELVARHLRQAGIKRLVIANRTLARAQDVAGVVDGDAVLLGDIPDLLIDVDIVIASTASALPILGKGAVERAMKHRKHRPYFMVDIAVPRDIEPQVGDLSDVFLYTVDDLKQVIDDGLKSREDAAQMAERLVTEGSQQYFQLMRASDVGRVVRRFRGHADDLKEQELRKALQAIQNGADPEAVLQDFSRMLTNKLIHEPTVQIRRAAADGNEELGQSLMTLFGLDDQ